MREGMKNSGVFCVKKRATPKGGSLFVARRGSLEL